MPRSSGFAHPELQIPSDREAPDDLLEDDDDDQLICGSVIVLHKKPAIAKAPVVALPLAERLCLLLPEISASYALAAGCGLIAGMVLSRGAYGIHTLVIAGLYLAILTALLGNTCLGAEHNHPSDLKSSVRTLMGCLFLMLITHIAAYLMMMASAWIS